MEVMAVEEVGVAAEETPIEDENVVEDATVVDDDPTLPSSR